MIGPAGFMAAPKAKEARDYSDFDALNVSQDVLNKMARAHKRGTGCRLTADEIHALSVTIIGQWWGQPDEREIEAWNRSSEAGKASSDGEGA